TVLKPVDRRESEMLLTLVDGRRIRFADDLREQLQLLEIGQVVSEIDGFQHGVVQQIASYDAENGTKYELTLRAWLDAMGDVASAAAVLHIHPNTLRYRYGRALDIFRLRMEDPDVRLLLHLQLRL